MRKSTRLSYVFGTLLILILLSACSNVTQPLADIQSSDAPSSQDDYIAPSPTHKLVGLFQNNDGRIEYTWDIPTAPEYTQIPASSAAPHYFSATDIQQIAVAVLGENTFYELGPKSMRVLSKSELNDKITVLEPYLDSAKREAIVRPYYGESDIQRYLVEYRGLYEDAPDTYSYLPCDWVLHNEKYYDDTGTSSMSSGNADALEAIAFVNGNDYYVSAYIENSSRYKRSSVAIELGDGMNPLLREIQVSEICDAKEPTQEQIVEAMEKSRVILDELKDIGIFQVIDASVTTIRVGNVPRYAILVRASQLVDGVPMLVDYAKIRSGVDDLNVNQSEISFPASDIRFIFNADGELIRFSMTGLMNRISSIPVSENLLSTEELTESAERILRARSFLEFDESTGESVWISAMENNLDESRLCLQVSINSVQYGLIRSDSTDGGASYRMVPAVMYSGKILCVEKSTGRVIKEFTYPLLLLNPYTGNMT